MIGSVDSFGRGGFGRLFLPITREDRSRCDMSGLILAYMRISEPIQRPSWEERCLWWMKKEIRDVVKASKWKWEEIRGEMGRYMRGFIPSSMSPGYHFDKVNTTIHHSPADSQMHKRCLLFYCGSQSPHPLSEITHRNCSSTTLTKFCESEHSFKKLIFELIQSKKKSLTQSWPLDRAVFQFVSYKSDLSQ